MTVAANEDSSDQHQLAQIYDTCSRVQYELRRYLDAIGTLTAGIEFLHALPITKHESDAILATMLNRRGMCHDELIRAEQAFADFDAAVQLFESLVNTRSKEHELSLALALHNRAKLFGLLGQLNEAREDDTKAIEICRQSDEKTSQILLATALITRGITYNLLGLLEQAEVDFDAAIAIFDKAASEKEVYADTSLAYAYLNRGNMHSLRANRASAINDFTKSISLYERSKKLPFDQREHAKALVNRAIQHGPQQLIIAIEDSRTAVGMYRRLISEGRRDLEKELENAEAVQEHAERRKQVLDKVRNEVNVKSEDESQTVLAQRFLKLAQESKEANRLAESAKYMSESEWWRGIP